MNQKLNNDEINQILGADIDWEDEEKEVKTYTAKLHIPVIEFGFVELEVENLNALEIANIFNDITKAFKPKIQIPSNNNFNSPVLCNVCNNGNMVKRYSKKFNKYFLSCDKYPNCKNARNV